MTPPLLRSCAFLFCAFAALFADARADPMTVHFAAMALSDGLADVTYKSGEKFTPLAADLFVPSKTVCTYTGDNPMGLYRSKNVNGKTQMVLVGSITFPTNASGKNYVLALVSAADGSCAGSLVPDSLADFPLKSLRIANLSPVPLQIDCNGKLLPLRPGQCIIVPLEGTDSYGVAVNYLRNGDPQQLTSSICQNNPANRDSLFLVMDNFAQYQANPNIMPQIRTIRYDDSGQSQRAPSKKRRN
jgi:hypothetical protein